jgi:hypothetical protein
MISADGRPGAFFPPDCIGLISIEFTWGFPRSDSGVGISHCRISEEDEQEMEKKTGR